MPITWPWETNEFLDKPKTKEERQREKIQKKLDKLQKKEAKFNKKLNKLNNETAETQNEVITDTRNNMNTIIWIDVNKISIANGNTSMWWINLWLEKNFTTTKGRTTSVQFGVGAWTDLNVLYPHRNGQPTDASDNGYGIDPSGWTADWGEISSWEWGEWDNDGSSTPIWASNKEWNDNGKSGIYVYTTWWSSEWDNNGGEIPTWESENVTSPGDMPDNTTNNTIPTSKPNVYINPELTIKTQWNSWFNVWGSIGWVYNSTTTNRNSIYGAGTVWYEKNGRWVNVTGWIKGNLVSKTNNPDEGITSVSDDWEDNGGSPWYNEKSMNSWTPSPAWDGTSEIQGWSYMPLETYNQVTLSPYWWVKVYKNWNNFSAYVWGNISGTGPTVTWWVAYKF